MNLYDILSFIQAIYSVSEKKLQPYLYAFRDRIAKS